MIDGLRSLTLVTPQLPQATEWWARALDVMPGPRADHAVEFTLGGTRLTLRAGPAALPATGGTMTSGQPRAEAGPLAFWGVDYLEGELARLVGLGATVVEPPASPEPGTRTVVLADPFGAVFGLVERDDPAERQARSQRAAERVALRQVRGTLDHLAASETEARRERRVAAWVMAAGAVLALLVVAWVVSSRQPTPQTLELRTPVAPTR
ncbi:VOC family protein [Ramlibacter sp.]|uniref:VOC family protein n=1 Tax=Ramlibacter sp. TaxID=1917967 RepID=UPI0035AE350E